MTVAVCAGSAQDHNNQNNHAIMMIIMIIMIDDDDDDSDYVDYDYDEGDDDDDSDHTKVMRPTDGEVSFNRAAHHEEDGTAQGDPGSNSQCDRQL